jgi:hypothetical protein
VSDDPREGRDVFHSFILLLVAFIMLAVMWGCSTVPHAVCPPLKAYPEGFAERLAGELEAMPADSATVEAIGDYLALRDSIRVCKP